jgi:hypothetical protein
MSYRFLADIVVVFHFAFILFAILGGILSIWWRKIIWLHVPVVLWAVLIEFAGWICPLTPLENWLHVRGGELGYSGGFVEHYILPILYPASLTRKIQVVLGTFVITVNLLIYWHVYKRGKRE